MEAVRLAHPHDALRLVRAYASDRIGVHPTAEVWDMGVDRQTWTSDVGSGVEWRYEAEEGRMQVFRFADVLGCRPFSFWHWEES